MSVLRATLVGSVVLLALVTAGCSDDDSTSGGALGPTTSEATTPPRPVRLVQGAVDLRTGKAGIDSVIAIDDGAMPNPDPGPYTAEFLDADGKQLSSVEFDVSVPVGDSPAGDGPAVDSPAGEGPTNGDSPSEQSADGLFVVPVAEPGPEAVTLRILRDGEELAVSKASEHPPTVEIESPSKGEILKGDEATIRWTGSDPDGDEVTYTLRHGIPGGMQTAGVDLTTTETSLFLDELGRGSTIRVQVIASDGFHSSQDEVSGVIVANP